MESDESDTPKPNRRFPTRQQRARLNKHFRFAAEKDSCQDYHAASNLYADCLRGDPGNYEYLRALMKALHHKYGDVKKLSPLVGFRARPERAMLREANAARRWDDALQHGFEILLVNPWDLQTLTQLANSCNGICSEEGALAASSYGDCELYYLKCAYDATPRDKLSKEFLNQMAAVLKKRNLG
jgi:hypothetical protein